MAGNLWTSPIEFAVGSLFWTWILFFGGADWLEGSFLSALLLRFHAPEWTAEGIRFFAMIVWLVQAILFVVWLVAEMGK